ncbi:MAG: hypothetical protein QXP36_12265, partial [Conexivisphaerales archaeon]
MEGDVDANLKMLKDLLEEMEREMKNLGFAQGEDRQKSKEPEKESEVVSNSEELVVNRASEAGSNEIPAEEEYSAQPT